MKKIILDNYRTVYSLKGNNQEAAIIKYLNKSHLCAEIMEESGPPKYTIQFVEKVDNDWKLLGTITMRNDKELGEYICKMESIIEGDGRALFLHPIAFD